MKLDVIGCKAWKFVNPYCVKNHSANCGFPVEKVYNNDDIAQKLTRNEKTASMVCRLLDCGLRTAWHMTVVSRFME
jgi:hypothetical protein